MASTPKKPIASLGDNFKVQAVVDAHAAEVADRWYPTSAAQDIAKQRRAVIGLNRAAAYHLAKAKEAREEAMKAHATLSALVKAHVQDVERNTLDAQLSIPDDEILASFETETLLKGP